MTASDPSSTAAYVFWVFLKLGLTAFGGPVAHLAHFRAELVQRRQWMTETAYAQLVALCQFLPGPASSQVGMAMGLHRAGLPGMAAAWLGFTLPSAVALAMLGVGWVHFGNGVPSGLLQGLKIAAIAVVFHAVWGMTQQLCPDRARKGVLLVGLSLSLLSPGLIGQLGVLLLGGLWGWWWFGRSPHLGVASSQSSLQATASAARPVSRNLAMLCLLALLALLVCLPLWSTHHPHPLAILVDTFFRTGALVFGGGHVVLPLLQAELVQPGLIDTHTFVAGYGATQAVPGPLFTFAAFLGSVLAQSSSVMTSFAYAAVAVLAVFAPSFLMVIGVWPFWKSLQQYPSVQHALQGVNAAVVGLLAAVFINPMALGTLHHSLDMLLCFAAIVALHAWKWAPWAVVGACALIGGLLLT